MNEDDSEIWTSDGFCIACRITFEVESEKLRHRNSRQHTKKWNLHKFFRDESAIHPAVSVSEMLERYKLKNLPVIGLQQCQEIQQLGVSSKEKTNFWTCTICYEAGDTYETADSHLSSTEHIRNYMDECECDEKEAIEEECQNDECAKYERYRAAAQLIFERDGGVNGLKPPSILRMNLSAAEGKTRFGIEDQIDITFRTCPDDGNNSVLHCNTCNEVVPVSVTAKYTKDKARMNHCENVMHQVRYAIIASLNEFNPQEIYDEFKTSESHAELHWVEKSVGKWYLSQPCGYRYSIKAGSDVMCAVCFALVDNVNLKEHFSSEYHTMKYLNMIHSYNSYLAHQLNGQQRRAKALKMLLSTLTLENDTKKVVRAFSRLPANIKSQLSDDVHVYQDPPSVEIDDFKETTGKVFRFCHSCSMYIEFDYNYVDTPEKMSVAWRNHVISGEHFAVAAMRNRIDFNPMYFVPYSSTITNAETEVKGTWKRDKGTLVQTQCDVGLEFLVEDEAAKEVACQCCWQVFGKNPVVVNQHIRSYDHLKQYIFLTAPDIVRILLGPEQEFKKCEFLMDLLQKHSGLFQKRMHLHSKMKTLELSKWAPISRRLVQTALLSYDFEREVYDTVLSLVDNVACDGEESIEMTAREALIAARMLIINTSRGADNELASVVCRCENCELLVVVNASSWQEDVFSNHICTETHRQRTKISKENTVSAFGILKEKSAYTVKPFIQKDMTKKVIWQWNQASKQHEYVANIIGLDDIIERRYPGMELGIPKEQADFYCQLCMKIFPKRATLLESHVREMDHCINWIHKYRSFHIRELFTHIENHTMDKGKELRKFLSSILKEVHPTEDYCMLVYDPLGEEERKQLAIMVKIQTEEKLKRLAEAKEKLATDTVKFRQQQENRQREFDERTKTERQKRLEDEERRREKEKQRQAERDARLQYAKAHATRFTRDTPEEMALKNRLEHASMIEKQQLELQKINVQQAKLKAERIRLLSKFPNSSNPQLVVNPQLNSSPASLNPYSNVPIGNPLTQTISNEKKPVMFDPSQQPPVSFFGVLPPTKPFLSNQPLHGGYVLNFAEQLPPLQEPPAYIKRPSIRGKLVDPAIHNPLTIKNKADLLNYMRRQGAAEILDPAEIPREFSQQVQDEIEAFGIDYVAEVICMDDPSLDSYLCTVCDCWSNPAGMLRHLCSTDHKSTYMYHKYPHYHAEVNRERNPVVRRNIYKNFTSDLKEKHIGQVMKTRMKTIIDKETIARLWPGYEDHFYPKNTHGAWSSGGFKPVTGSTIVLPEVVPVAPLLKDDMDIDNSDSLKRKRDSRGKDRSRSRDRFYRSRSRERKRQRSRSDDRRRRSRTRSRSRSRERYYRDRSRRDGRTRSRTRSRSRSRGRSPRSRQSTWSEQTDSFLAKLRDTKTASTAPSVPLKLGTAGDFNSKLATVRDLTTSGIIKGSSIEGICTSVMPPAPIAPTQSTEERRRLEREKMEYEANLNRKAMGAMMMMEDLIKEHNGQLPREEMLTMYKTVGLSPDEGDAVMLKLVDNMRLPETRGADPKRTISQSISSLGIQLNATPGYTSATQYQQRPPVHSVQPAYNQQYGISSGVQPSSSAYSQVFGSTSLARPISPISASIVPLKPYSSHTSTQPQQQSFYQNPPTSISYDSSANKALTSSINEVVASSDDSSDDDEYSEVYKLIGKDTDQKKKQKEQKPSNSVDPIIPGQKMALKRTILPNGAPVGESQNIIPQQPTPSQYAQQYGIHQPEFQQQIPLQHGYQQQAYQPPTQQYQSPQQAQAQVQNVLAPTYGSGEPSQHYWLPQ